MAFSLRTRCTATCTVDCGHCKGAGPVVTVRVSTEPETVTRSSCSGCEVHVYTVSASGHLRQHDGGPLVSRLQDAAEGRYGPVLDVLIVPVIRQGEAARR